MLHALPVLTAALTSLGVLVMPASAPSACLPPAPAVAIVVAAPAAPPRVCGPEPSSADGWQRVFDSLDGEWSGADGSSSTRLRDGRLLWVFGDTLVGSVSASGVRSPGTRLVRNSMVVTDGDCATPYSTRTDALASGDTTWLWPTHSVVTSSSAAGSELAVYAQRVERTSSGPAGFRRVGTSVVTVNVAAGQAPSVGGTIDLPTSEVLWGAAVVRDGTDTWIYGTRDHHEALVFGRDLLLARAPTASAGDPTTWRYRTASGSWSSRESRAAVVRSAHAGVSTVPSAAKIAGSFRIVTKPQEFVDERVVVLSATHPWGPWTERLVAIARSTDARPRYSPAFVAGAFTGGRGVVVVNQTSTSLSEMLSDAGACRPRFVDVSGLR